MKKLGFVVLGIILLFALFVGSRYGGSSMDEYTSEKDASQTLTVLANNTSVRTLLVGMFTKPEGYYFLQKNDSPSKGRQTRDQSTFNLKEEGGREWKLTIQPDMSLRDENGVTWHHKSHAESNASVEQNRATCNENLGKDCPY